MGITVKEKESGSQDAHNRNGRPCMEKVSTFWAPSFSLDSTHIRCIQMDISLYKKERKKKEHFLLPKSMGISNYFFVPIFFDRVGQCVCVPRQVFFFPFLLTFQSDGNLPTEKKYWKVYFISQLGSFLYFARCVCVVFQLDSHWCDSSIISMTGIKSQTQSEKGRTRESWSSFSSSISFYSNQIKK